MREQFYEDIQSFVDEHNIKIYEIRNTWKENQVIENELREYERGVIYSTRLATVHHHWKWIKWMVES